MKVEPPLEVSVLNDRPPASTDRVHFIFPYQETARLAFSWEGEDDMDPVSGRGWAIIEDGQLQGRLYFHEGDESGFMAEKEG